MAPRKATPKMSDDHKAALAEGRTQSRVVRNYLEALEAHKPKRGRKRTTDSISKRLARIEEDLPTVDPIRRIVMLQERLDLQKELAASDQSVDISQLEEEFIAVAAEYSERKGISYTAWRQIGVTPAVLKSAGVNRTRG